MQLIFPVIGKQTAHSLGEQEPREVQPAQRLQPKWYSRPTSLWHRASHPAAIWLLQPQTRECEVSSQLPAAHVDQSTDISHSLYGRFRPEQTTYHTLPHAWHRPRRREDQMEYSYPLQR